MPMTFQTYPENNYFEATMVGLVPIDELIKTYLDFFASDEWQPGMTEFTDLSQADLSNLHAKEMLKLSEAIGAVYQKHNMHNVKNAIYTPDTLHFGRSGMYEVFGSMAGENVCVFSDKETALRWLLS